MGKGSDPAGFMGFRQRHLFNLYLVLGSISIVVATTLFTINISRAVERQSYLTTRLLSDVASRLITAEDISDIEPVMAIGPVERASFVIRGSSITSRDLCTKRDSNIKR